MYTFLFHLGSILLWIQLQALGNLLALYASENKRITPCEIRNLSVCATICTLGSVASVQEIRGLLLVWMWLAVSLEILSVFRGYRT